MTQPYGEPITADTLPEPVWGPRRWTDQGYEVGRPLSVAVYQALFPLVTTYGLALGVRKAAEGRHPDAAPLGH